MKPALILMLCLVLSGTAIAQSPVFYSTHGVAIQGYDPVAYFTEQAAVAGLQQYAYTWHGVEWHFKQQANLDLFKANPEKYAPQFGGYCAYGVSENHKSPTEPAAFTIVNDKLYLNYNLKVRALWQQNIPGRIAQAESNWIQLKDKTDK